MIRTLILFLLAQTCCSSAEDSKIYGSWHSDAEATSANLAKFAKLNEFQKKAFPSVFGRATITFNRDGSGTIEMKAAKFPKMDGSEIDVPASKTEFRFEILGEAESQIVIKSTSEEVIFQDHPFAILKIHDDDTYSVSLSDGIAMIYGREFFTRIDNKKANKAEMATPRKPSD
jgi:hypothetical protein